MMMELDSKEKIDLTEISVYTDIMSDGWLADKKWVDFYVPTDWLRNILADFNLDDLSDATEVTKECILRASIEDGVIRW